jgi:hypothetical protein
MIRAETPDCVLPPGGVYRTWNELALVRPGVPMKYVIAESGTTTVQGVNPHSKSPFGTKKSVAEVEVTPRVITIAVASNFRPKLRPKLEEREGMIAKLLLLCDNGLSLEQVW